MRELFIKELNHVCGGHKGPGATTLALGEEDGSSRPRGRGHDVTTLALGEEDGSSRPRGRF